MDANRSYRHVEQQDEHTLLPLRSHPQGSQPDPALTQRQLAAIREEERRRLRRDIHDGLGPKVAAVVLQADTARELIDSDPGGAKVLLAHLTDQARSILFEIQHLVQGLRPPGLDRLGLVEALRGFLHTLAGSPVQLRLEVIEPLPALPAATETAAYRIVTEAVTNVLRHAEAHCCCVRLQAGECLTIEVLDDGYGVPVEPAGGIGLLSMRERAQELGGGCTIERLAAGGTRVYAWLPLC